MKHKVLFPAILMAVIAIFAACSDDDQPQGVLGDWYAEYAAPGITDYGAYDRVVQAYHFSSDGTGYWYNFFLADGLDEPVGMKGGHNIGSFTYTVSESNINIQLNSDVEMENTSWNLTPAEGSISGSDGDIAYTLTRATNEQMKWCNTWDEIINGGNDSYGIVMTMEKYTLDTDAGPTQTDNGIKWNLGYTLIVGNNDKDATISRVPVFPVYDIAYLLHSYVNKFANNKPLWAAAGMELVEQTDATTGTFRFPNTYACLMSVTGTQGISVPLVAYTPAKSNTLTFRHVGAGVGVDITNSTANPLIVDEVIVKSKNYRLSSEALTLHYDEDDMHYTPETTSNAEERIVKIQFPSTGIGVFEIQPNTSGSSVVVPILPVGNDELTVEVRCHIACEGLIEAENKCVYSRTFEVQGLTRAQLVKTKADIAIGTQNVEACAFSVSATKSVYFSKANLKAHCTKMGTDPHEDLGFWKAWEFTLLGSQYETVENNGNISDFYASMEDATFFSYGCSGYENGQYLWKPNTTMYMGRFGNYIPDYEIIKWYNGALTGTAEWGYNAITNAGNKENSGWRTLTGNEWDYVIRYRANAASKRGLANVNSVNGLILLPDQFTLPEGLSWTSGEARFSDNVYTAEQWARMEAAGAVFLPAAGGRYSYMEIMVGTPPPYISDKGAEGLYWASTDSGNSTWADMLYFFEGEITTGNQQKCDGCNVRLVLNAN